MCAWYPITPSSSLAEAFAAHCYRLRRDPETKKHRYAIIQAEDELASIGMVIGAAWNGARAFTATSGPGISLMQEFIGLAYFAEIPAVIFDIQRGSPSTGMPTRTQQADILSAAYASHGDTKHVLLFPQDPNESFTFAADALDLADRLQTPVFVMMDLDIGMNDWLVPPLKWDPARQFDRGKVMTFEDLEAGKDFGRYLDVDGDGIPYRTYPGTHPTRGAFFTRGTTKDRYARYTEEGGPYVDNMQRLLRKFETAKRYRAAPDQARGQGADEVRRDLFRLVVAGDGRGARRARGACRDGCRAPRAAPAPRPSLGGRAEIDCAEAGRLLGFAPDRCRHQPLRGLEFLQEPLHVVEVGPPSSV